MLQQSFDLALESGVGAGGIPDAAFEKALIDLAPALARLKGEIAAAARLALRYRRPAAGP
jgi:glucose-6-phosphate isomerase